MEALVEKLCNRFSGVTGMHVLMIYSYTCCGLIEKYIPHKSTPTLAETKQWEYISYSLSLLTFTEKGIKKLIESFKSYEHALAEDLVTENFRSIINKVTFLWFSSPMSSSSLFSCYM